MSANDALGYCGRCFRTITTSTGGFVSSCTDFLCPICVKAVESTGQCPACGKHGIQTLDLTSSDLNAEVRNNLSDTSVIAAKLKEATNFQIKHYKITIKRLQQKCGQLNNENAQLKRVIGELRNGSNGQSRNAENLRPRTQMSLNSVLTNPINPSLLPPEREQRLNNRPVTSAAGRPDSSALGKRFDNTQNVLPQTSQPPQSQYFAGSQAQPDLKRMQTASSRLGGNNSISGGTGSTTGSFQRALEVNRPTGLPLGTASSNSAQQQRYAPPAPTQQHPPQQQPQSQQQSRQYQQANPQQSLLPSPQYPVQQTPHSVSVDWGFGNQESQQQAQLQSQPQSQHQYQHAPPPTGHLHAVTPSSNSSSVTLIGSLSQSQYDRPPSVGGGGGNSDQYHPGSMARPHSGAGAGVGAGGGYEVPSSGRASTPTNMGRPASANSQHSPAFLTPSRLRSPHVPIPRSGSGGPGRLGGRGQLPNPMQSVGVTLSQNQGAMQGFPGF